MINLRDTYSWILIEILAVYFDPLTLIPGFSANCPFLVLMPFRDKKFLIVTIIPGLFDKFFF